MLAPETNSSYRHREIPTKMCDVDDTSKVIRRMACCVVGNDSNHNVSVNCTSHGECSTIHPQFSERPRKTTPGLTKMPISSFTYYVLTVPLAIHFVGELAAPGSLAAVRSEEPIYPPNTFHSSSCWRARPLWLWHGHVAFAWSTFAAFSIL